MNRSRGALIALGVALAFWPRRAAANGAPIKIELRYIEGISNYGPRTATGLLELVEVEGDAYLQVQGLPRLTGELYQAWLTNRETGDRISIGKFNTDPNGVATLDTILEIADRRFDLVVVSVEPEPDPSPNPRRAVEPCRVLPGHRAEDADGASPGRCDDASPGRCDDASANARARRRDANGCAGRRDANGRRHAWPDAAADEPAAGAGAPAGDRPARGWPIVVGAPSDRAAPIVWGLRRGR